MNLKDASRARPSASDPPEPVEKRQKVTRDFFPPKPPTPQPREKEQTESSAAGGSKAVQKSMGSDDRVALQEFAPSYATADGRIVSVEDSVKLEPGLASTMLRGLGLPRDMEKVLEDLQPSLIHASAYLVQVRLNLTQF